MNLITKTRVQLASGCGYYVTWYRNGWHVWNFNPGKIEYRSQGQKYITTGQRAVQINSGAVTAAQIAAIRTLVISTECYLLTDGGQANIRPEQATVTVSRSGAQAFELTVMLVVNSRKLSDTGFSVYVPSNLIPLPAAPPEDGDTADWYVGRYNADGSGETHLAGLNKIMYVTRLATGLYQIYQSVNKLQYITLGVGEGSSLISLRAMDSATRYSHVVHVSDDATQNDYPQRFLTIWGAIMENAKIYVGQFNAAGTSETKLFGADLSVSVSKVSTGRYELTHGIGHTNYIVLGVGIGDTNVSLRSMTAITANTVEVNLSDDAAGNDEDTRFIILYEDPA